MRPAKIALCPLMIAFVAAMAMQGTGVAHLLPLVDPAVLALLALLILRMPFREAREAFTEILVMSPPELNAIVRTAMAQLVARRGFLDDRSYVSKAGRARFIEVAVLLPGELRLSIGELDALRAEIGEAIAGEGPERWLTIVFTADAAEL